MKYYLKKHWKLNALIILLTIVYAGLAILPNLTMMYMTQGIIDRDLQVFLNWMWVELFLYLMMAAMSCILTWTKSKAKRAMNNNLRSDIAATLLGSDHGEFHAKQSGEYLSRFSNDVTQIQTLAWDSFYNIILITGQVIFSCIILGNLHWSLLALSAVASVVMLYSPRLESKRMEMMSKEYADAQGQAMSRMKDLLAGMDVLRSFGRTQRFLQGSQEASDEVEAGRHKFICNQSFSNQVIFILNLLTQIGSIVAIAILSINGTILQGTIIGGGNMVGTISSGLSEVSQLLLSIRSSKPYFDKITVHADDITEDSSLSPSVKNAITVENLSFSYGEKPILENASFRFQKGGKYALTGPSGCGKSTLLKLLLGWLPDYSGAIRFDGQDAREFSAEQLQQSMSYIEQDVFLFNTTIRENITLGGDFTEEQINRAIRDSALEGDLSSMPLGLDTPVGEDGSNLSGGQKQRVAIARALIHERSILLVDEGTSALDQKNADIVEMSLLENPDLTLILVSHHLTGERKKQFTQVYHLDPIPAA